MKRVWAIKLGSGGSCVDFCERHKMVGIGWKNVDHAVLKSASRDAIWDHVCQRVTSYQGDARKVGAGVGQIYRFARECQQDDYVLYYDPPRRHVRIGRITSDLKYRDFDLSSDIDIWHYRDVEFYPTPINILDLHGNLKGRLLGPRMSFWEIGGAYELVDRIVRGVSIQVITEQDAILMNSFSNLQDLLVRRAESLNDQDWEWLVVDYLKAQGAHVDERRVGKSHAIIDAEARFDHGEFGEQVWRVQVKRLHKQKIDWPTIEKDYRHIGDAEFCFVSVFGFTEDARVRAAEKGIRLLEAGDFARFLLSGKLRSRLRERLRLPFAL